jgi:hypothetical protein
MAYRKLSSEPIIDCYYLAFPGDNVYKKALVALLFIMELFQTAASLVDGFRWFGKDYGNLDELDQIGLMWFTFVLWGSLSR